MTTEHIEQWIRHPEMLDRDSLYELRTLLVKYPYFQTLYLLYLKNLYVLHDADFGAELRDAVLYIADRRKLFQLIEGGRFDVQRAQGAAAKDESVCEEEPTVDRTLSLIDAFLSTAPEEVKAQTGLDYSMDYTSFLIGDDGQQSEEAEEAPKLKGFELIDDFIEKNEHEPVCVLKPISAVPIPEDTVPSADASSDNPSAETSQNRTSAETSSDNPSAEEEDDSCFTETLAKIYIKQHRYSKALEIIKKLSLKYPKKNAYFADQIRFLEKLIINANSK